MKKIISSVIRCNGQSFATPFLCCLLFVIGLSVTGCKKEMRIPIESNTNVIDETPTTESNILSGYTGLSPQTMWELQQARAATARYRNIENARNDGYSDINVVVQEMGHHYMKSSLADAEFDYRNPEILVYNREEDGSFKLVAVEYAVPLSLSANAPAGFSGSQDVWDGNTFFQLWLLHAWVWEFNPEGVFNPTNPSVHVH